MALRARLKHWTEGVLARGGPAALHGMSRRGRTLVLAYHNILPLDAPPGRERSLHLSRSDFAAQLDLIMEHADVVPLTEGLTPAADPSARPRVVLTFDDAYAGALTAGLEELRRRSLPATVFVAPAFIGGRAFWWDALDAGGAEGLPEAVRHACLWEAAGQDAWVRDWAMAAGIPWRDVPAHACAATETELNAAARYTGLTLASHTWEHPNLAALTGTVLQHELEAPLLWLAARGSASSILSYPYGLTSAAVAVAAQAAGYTAALLISGGWITRTGVDPFRLPRFNVPAGISLDGFRLRLAGLGCR